VRLRVPDTTVFVELIREPRNLEDFLQSVERGQIYLSSVVAMELYAGTRSREEALVIDQIVNAFVNIERVITPNWKDWATSGRLIGRRSRLTGSIRPRDHLADVLIVVSAARLNGEVVSANARHMESWIEMARRSGLDVTLAE
jgi:predicted nucleic acid-binding protein